MNPEPWQNQVITASAANTAPVELPQGPTPADLRRMAINARFELAERSVDMNEQFARAESGSGRQALPHADRATIRDRIRHEMFEADPWMKGSARTTVVSVVGRGPYLEVEIPDQPEVSKFISRKFNHWFRKRIHGPRKFRTMCYAKQSDGAGLGLVVNDPNCRGRVKLNFVPFEDEQIRGNPSQQSFIDQVNYLLDGKEFDDVGRPSIYHICERHPGEHPEDIAQPVAASFVIDVWDQERPSQGRGVSPYATSTKNGPLRRSFRRAVLDSATTAAKHSFLMKTNIDRFHGGDIVFTDQDPFTGVPVVYGEGMALPKGWEPMQLKAENPGTDHDGFMRSNVSEMGRAAGQPGPVTLSDPKGINFAAGQLARSDWADDVDVQRQDWEDLALDKLLEHWLAEAALVYDEIPREFADIDKVPHEYRWTRKRHQDTNKEYSGRAKAIATGQTSRAQWQTDDGLNPDQEDEAAAKGFGVDVETYRLALYFSTFGKSAELALKLKGKLPDDSETDDRPPDSGNPEQPPPPSGDDQRESTNRIGSDAELDAAFSRNGFKFPARS